MADISGTSMQDFLFGTLMDDNNFGLGGDNFIRGMSENVRGC